MKYNINQPAFRMQGNCGFTILKKVFQCPISDSRSKEKSNPKNKYIK